MTAVIPLLELTDLVLEQGGEDLHACMQCAACSGVCPWTAVSPFRPRTLLRLVALGLEGYEAEDLWRCVTCNSCVRRCPRGVDLVDVMRAARAVMLEAGSAPPTYRQPLGSLRKEGNPWGGARADRRCWAEGLALPEFDGSQQYLYFTCCAQAYDPRNRQVGRALMSLLGKAGLRFGVLGTDESCCGDQARKMGAESVYQALRQANIALLQERGVEQVIVGSPHCLQVFNLQYAQDVAVTAAHYTQVLAERLRAGELSPTRPLGARVTYHDPCYLGRHAGQYEAPRALLRGVPDLELVEMPRNRELSLCCGGGGGGLWLDVPPEQRFALQRVEEARQTGASIIATACPYCTSMLEDAIKTLDLEGAIAVKDVAELLDDAVP